VLWQALINLIGLCHPKESIKCCIQSARPGLTYQPDHGGS